MTRHFVTYLNINFKCTTVKSSFATDVDMRMSKHILKNVVSSIERKKTILKIIMETANLTGDGQQKNS